MKRLVVLAAIVVLFGSAPAHAGGRLTTGSSGGSEVECAVVNISETKTITVAIKSRRIGSSTPIDEDLSAVLLPLRGNFGVDGGGFTDVWCEFLVVSGGSAKDLRGSMLMYDGTTFVGTEPAREK